MRSRKRSSSDYKFEDLQYTLKNKVTEISQTKQIANCVKVGPNNNTDETFSEDIIVAEIMTRILYDHRNNKLKELFLNFTGDVKDRDAVKMYLPKAYNKYAHDMKLLKEQLGNMSEMYDMYEITDIEPVTKCFGCMWNCSGQRDHMHGPSGCLYTSN